MKQVSLEDTASVHEDLRINKNTLTCKAAPTAEDLKPKVYEPAAAAAANAYHLLLVPVITPVVFIPINLLR